MSSEDQSLILKVVSNLRIYLFKIPNEYLLCLTIIVSIITVILILSIVLDSEILLIFSPIDKSSKNSFFQSTFLNWLLNSSNHIKNRFFNELICSLNQRFFSRKVKNNIFITFDLWFFVLGTSEYRNITIF
jgi:hypothetical protein